MDIERFLKNALIQMELDDNGYLNSFVRDENFRGRRFTRYVGKVKDGLFVYVKNNTPNYDLIYNYNAFKTTNILDYFYANLIIYTQCMNRQLEHLKPVLFLFNLPEVPSIILDGNEKLIDDTLSNTNIIYPMIDDEIANACLEHLAYLSGLNEDINNVNYVRETLPFSDVDNLKIINDIFFRLIVNLEHLIMINHDYTSTLGEEVVAARIENDELIEDIEKIEKELFEKNQLIEKLKTDILNEREKQKRNARKMNEEILKENYELLKENEKLREKIEEMHEGEMREETRESEDKTLPLDVREINYINLTSKKLVFIISERCTFLNELQSAFSNAKITFKNYARSIEKADVVVVFTQYVNHTTYYDVKEICRLSGTKLLHCNHSNIEKVREILLKNIRA